MRIKLLAKGAKAALPDGEWIARSIDAALREAADEALKEYRKTTRTWKTVVNFYVRKTKTGYSVGTRSKIYGYVDRGTRAHVIRARRVPYLSFSYPTGPKTKPGVIASYNGKTPGPNWARRKSVNHPGGKPRRFTEIIYGRITKRVRVITRRRFADAVKRRKPG